MIEDRTVGPPERLHRLFLLTGIGGRLRGLLGLYVGVAYLSVRGELRLALGVALLVLLVSALGLFLYWRRFEFRVGAGEIRIDSGILSRTHRSIPFDRVQDVDIVQGPLMRLLGLATVKFETGGSAAAGAEDGVLQAISLERAQQLRALVRAHRSGAASLGVPGSEATEQPPVFAMDLRRLLTSGLFNFSLAVFAGLIGVTQTMGDFVGFDPLNRRFWMAMFSADHPVAQFLLANRALTVALGILVLVLVGLATGLIRTALRDYGFRIDRAESGLRRRRGLLTRTDVTLPARRAQAAIVATGPVRDRFGWRELKMQSLARDEGGSGDHVLAPLARDDEIDTILGTLGWRQLGPTAWLPVSPAYVWSFAAQLLGLALVAGGALLWAAPLAAAATLGLLALLVGVRALAWRRIGWALDGDRLLVRRGWWRRTLLVLPIGRIQSADLKRSVVDRLSGVTTLRLGVAGGSGFAAHSIPALRDEKARELRSLLLSDVS